MSKFQLQRRVRLLESALRPFARFSHESAATKIARGETPDPNDVFVPDRGDVWFYIGQADPRTRAHLHTDDFQRARSLVA